MNDIRINSKYAPLFSGVKTRYYIITGGRGSGKTFATSLFQVNDTFNDDYNILYTRYTLTSAEISIIPEYQDKINILGISQYFTKSGNNIHNIVTGANIFFRGIKTSEGIQTAALKSIPRLKRWVNDESEELVDERTFDTIDLSLRELDIDISVWLILNPPDIVQSSGEEHFIYRRFFRDKGIDDGFCGVVDDTTYIHTTYLDNENHLNESFLEQAEKCRVNDIDKFNNIYLGYWGKRTKGLIYNNWEEILEEDYPTDTECWYGVDWGFTNDPSAIVRISYENRVIYLKELQYQREQLTIDNAKIIKNDILNRKRLLYASEGINITCCDGAVYINNKQLCSLSGFDANNYISDEAAIDVINRKVRRILNYDGEVYCDPSRPEGIKEMRLLGLSAIGADNRDKSGRLEYLKYFKVKYVGENIKKESSSYKWKSSKFDKTIYINVPCDSKDGCPDHLMDAINYGAVTHLRRAGVVNEICEQ